MTIIPEKEKQVDALTEAKAFAEMCTNLMHAQRNEEEQSRKAAKLKVELKEIAQENAQLQTEMNVRDKTMLEWKR